MTILKKGILAVAVLCAGGLGAWWSTTSTGPSAEPEAPERQSESQAPELEVVDAAAEESGPVTPRVRKESAVSSGGHPSPDSETTPVEDEVLRHFHQRGCIDRSLTRVEQLTPTRRATLKAWLESEGHFGDISMTPDMNVAPFDDYSSYSTEALRQLARDPQDAKAQVALATRLFESGELEEAKQWFRESAINGYSATVTAVGAMEMMSQFRSNTEEHEEVAPEELQQQMREAFMEFLAYMEFAAIRGAPGARASMEMFTNPEQTPLNFAGEDGLSEEQLARSRERGRELFNSFEAERMDRGLPPFDNSRPEIADLLDADMRSMIRAMGEGLRPCDMPELPTASD